MSNLPIELRKESFFRRIISFFKNLFKKDIKPEAETIEKENETPESKIIEMYKVEGVSVDNIKKDSNATMKEIIDIIEKNPETLEKLDIEKLELIDQYYVEQIAKYKKLLGKIA